MEALIKIGVDTRGVSQNFVNQLFNDQGVLDTTSFGAGVAGFLGGGSPVLPVGGTGTTSNSNTTVNVSVLDADPTAVVNAIEKYVRENGSAPVATSTFTRK